MSHFYADDKILGMASKGVEGLCDYYQKLASSNLTLITLKGLKLFHILFHDFFTSTLDYSTVLFETVPFQSFTEEDFTVVKTQLEKSGKEILARQQRLNKEIADHQKVKPAAEIQEK